jgi:hypothetical protein
MEQAVAIISVCLVQLPHEATATVEVVYQQAKVKLKLYSYYPRKGVFSA